MASWKQQTRSFFQTALDFAFPPICVACQAPGTLICEPCQKDVLWLSDCFCPSCDMHSNGTLCCESFPQAIYTAVSYIGPIPKAIHHLKYEGHFALAPVLADYMIRAWNPHWVMPAIVMPIPLHRYREKERGYNQSALLARQFSSYFQLDYRDNVLARVIKTTRQVGLSARARQENVANAFEVKDIVRGQTVLLIDDVYTTGATIKAAAQALRDAGAESVGGLALAKSSLNDF